MSKPRVLCNVANCKYWGNGNLCTADAILVEVDGDRDYSTEASAEISPSHPHKEYAKTTAETCCHTFTPKS